MFVFINGQIFPSSAAPVLSPSPRGAEGERGVDRVRGGATTGDPFIFRSGRRGVISPLPPPPIASVPPGRSVNFHGTAEPGPGKRVVSRDRVHAEEEFAQVP